jgi:hypothetical protein
VFAISAFKEEGSNGKKDSDRKMANRKRTRQKKLPHPKGGPPFPAWNDEHAPSVFIF